jgi:hypothetical protein
VPVLPSAWLIVAGAMLTVGGLSLSAIVKTALLYRSPTVAFPVGLVRDKLTVSSASSIASSAIAIVTIFGVVSPAAKLIAIGVLV